ncbi:cysteine-rich secretory protein LCCL domain-containing 2 [Trichomycterus rosablanca]|uniref:cysteine-rich secretory protein LCCL domain-containing 2 n=1 Tax=Trichomycterus rosablanca TaxID=2290929 RepID=UPI002F35E297
MLRLLSLALMLLAARLASGLFLPDSPELRKLLSRYQDEMKPNITASVVRTRRDIQWSDREEILALHNKLRGGVYPAASNMEYMVWDDELERTATQWAEQCQWDHGPQDLLKSIGQNLAVHYGRYRSPAYHVQAWYDEVKDYTYPYPHECNPWCPERCSGPMCTHYTQIVWATTNRVGCAVHVCPLMNVWGNTWENAVYLVCNYSPKGNWIGEAPYQHGRPCSQCPPSYGGGCRENLCYNEDQHHRETPDMNEVEKLQVGVQPQTTSSRPVSKPEPRPSSPRRPTSTNTKQTNFLTQKIKCETKMRDKCKGPTCNRYNCPANCQYSKARVWGTLFYDVQSSICRAAIHSGVIDNNGGLVEITRKDKVPFFVRSMKNDVESLSKYKVANAFMVAAVEKRSVYCYTTAAEICTQSSNCPRVLCPANCKNEPSYWAPVIGTNIYADSSSICRAALHAGAIKVSGGYLDILAMDRRKSYSGSLKNGIQSQSKTQTQGGSFRVFTVRE